MHIARGGNDFPHGVQGTRILRGIVAQTTALFFVVSYGKIGAVMKTTSLPPLMEKLLTRGQVAALFGVTKHTVRMYERRGLLSSLRLNHRVVRYDAADVQQLLAKCRV